MVSRECMAVVDYHFYLFKPTCSIFSTIKNGSMSNIKQFNQPLKYFFQFCYILYSSTRLAHSFFPCANFLFTYPLFAFSKCSITRWATQLSAPSFIGINHLLSG